MNRDPLGLGVLLYGFRRRTLTAAAEVGHEECNVGQFCRNPLHPGPCKGWKKNGAAGKAAKALKSGPRDGDGDGKLNEGKDDRHAAAKAMADAWKAPPTPTRKAESAAKTKAAKATKAPATKAVETPPEVAKALGPPEPKSFSDHRKGTDLFAANPSGLALDVTKERAQYDGKAADTGLAAIGAKQGFGEKPRVVSRAEMDDLVAAGHPELHRGVKSIGSTLDKPGKAAADVHEDMRTGDAYYGNGIYGNGYYWGDMEAAKPYADSSRGSIARAVLDPNAKIVNWDDLEPEHEKFLDSLAGHPHEAEMRDVYGDPGRYAAARGWDAIIKIPQGKNAGAPYYNVLNRTAMVIQEADK